MKLVVTSDLHLHPSRICSRDGGKDRLHDGLGALRQTFEFARAHKCPWLCCGDMKVPKLSWPQEALTGALALFEEFDDVPKLMLPGNHDGDSSHIGGSGLAPFRKHALVIEEPRIVEWAGPRIAVAPWQAHRDLTTLFHDAARLKTRILATHGFLAGTFLGPDDVRLPGKGLSLVDLGIGEHFDLALMGDIHKGQRLVRAGKRPPVWKTWTDLLASSPHPARHRVQIRVGEKWNAEAVYSGSPYQQSWGERDEPKGALLIDVESGQIDFLAVLAPRFRKVDLTSLKFDAIEALLAEARTWAGDFLLVHASETAIKAKVTEKLRTTAQPRWFHVIPIQAKTVEKRAEISATMAPEELLSAYMKSRPFPGSVAAASVLIAGLRLLTSSDES